MVQGPGSLAVPHGQISLTCCHTASWGRGSASTSRVCFSHSRCCVDAGAAAASRGPLSRRKLIVEKLWRNFFADPSQWWDNRSEKINSRYPDFKHKKKEHSLWLNNELTPSWVEAELAAIAPGTLQPHTFSWHVKLRKHAKDGDYWQTLNLFQQMQREGLIPDKFTFVPVLNACSNLRLLEKGRRVHEQIIESGCESDVFVGNSLVDMYAKCGSIEDAQRVFNKMSSHTVVSWTALILGYVKSGDGQKALGLYQQMQQEGVDPNSVTFVAVLNACAITAALQKGRHVHEQIIERGYSSDVFVASSLVDMYAKCGSIEDARKVFDNISSRNVVSWNAMLAGYAKHGRVNEALEHFERMCQEGLEVNGVTFVCLLSACSHGGLAEKGLAYFESMSEFYNISPTREHYACVVDLLGRAGNLQKAEDLLRSMPCEPGATLWRTLLGACRNHGDVQRGERVAKHVLELDPKSASGYVLLSNIYSAGGRRDSAVMLQDQRLGRNVNKQPREHRSR